MNEAILFPGQGAQFEGMGRDWCEAFPIARETFAEASEHLGFSLEKACWDSGDDINRTDIAQPGILVTSIAAIRVLEQETGLDRSKASMTAGLSLGEYTALWCAGSLDFGDAVKLVRLRGQAMQDAAEQIPSGMLSLMGGDEPMAKELAAIASAHGICAVANLNAPGQVILSGEHKALEAAAASAKDVGVRRTRALVVAGGFHSECMRPAADRLAAALGDVTFGAPVIPFVTNVTGKPSTDPAQIPMDLAEQVCSPVRWEDSMRWALGQGIQNYLEPAPGAVLAGIMRKIDPEAIVRSAAKPSLLTEEGSS
ncbi:MAG: ACP S-malonyltransferase [Planctomycetota bacterium]|nr:ACP S-malonyltransferase [Planctomycetota bacterium]MDG2143006.1 ACP S-malonyltransferase [Planctomycetota bacterium]